MLVGMALHPESPGRHGNQTVGPIVALYLPFFSFAMTENMTDG